MEYKVKLISQEKKREFMKSLNLRQLYQAKAEIHGTCIKLLTDNKEFRNMWVENFKGMLETIRPHGRIFCICTKSKKMSVEYEPLSNTLIVKNCDYYGLLKSVALALVADFIEKFTSEHRRYSLHTSYVDSAGRGVCMMGLSKSGKTTLTYGLMLEKKYNFVTDDWIFVRLYDNEIVVNSSEKNSYIRDDLGEVWGEYKDRIKNIKFDKYSRSILDVTKLFGDGRVRKESVMTALVLLKRDKKDRIPFRKLSAKEALDFLIKNDFCNPHMLVRNKEKKMLRVEFFKELISRTDVYMLNTIETPQESLEHLKKLF